MFTKSQSELYLANGNHLNFKDRQEREVRIHCNISENVCGTTVSQKIPCADQDDIIPHSFA